MAILLQRKCGGPPPARAGPRLLAASPCAPWAKNLLMTVAASIRGKTLGAPANPTRHRAGRPTTGTRPQVSHYPTPGPPQGRHPGIPQAPGAVLKVDLLPPTPPPPHYLEREYLERIGSRHRKIILGKQRTGCAARRRWEIGKRCVLEQTCKLQIQLIGKRKEAKRKVCMGVDM
jgi:hypothetical protein